MWHVWIGKSTDKQGCSSAFLGAGALSGPVPTAGSYISQLPPTNEAFLSAAPRFGLISFNVVTVIVRS